MRKNKLKSIAAESLMFTDVAAIQFLYHLFFIANLLSYKGGRAYTFF
jgi:hypothetical protein